MTKTSRKNNSSRKNKKTKKNVKHYSRKNNIKKMRGGIIKDYKYPDSCSICLGRFLFPIEWNETEKYKKYKPDGMSSNITVNESNTAPPVFLNDPDVGELPCNHIFHRSCLDKWIAQGHNTCPNCRAFFTIAEIIAIDSERINYDKFYFIKMFEKFNYLYVNSFLSENLIYQSNNTLKAIIEALIVNDELKILDISNLNFNSVISPEFNLYEELLKNNKNLTELITGSNVSGFSTTSLAKGLKDNTTLTNLSLIDIGDEGAVALADALKHNKGLTKLHINKCNISAVGAQDLANALKNNSTLTELDISNNDISDGGANALADALKTNSTLTTLDISINQIGNVGVVALAEALKTETTNLTELNIEFNSFNDTGAVALIKAFDVPDGNKTLTLIHARGNNIDDEIGKQLYEVVKNNRKI